jgi:hypothetical protein
MSEGVPAFADFELVLPNKLNAVFVKGRARTLWLNLVQRRSTLRADHKVLSGPSLQDALDPLGDQAYTFTAARCQNDVAAPRSTYGIAPRKSRLWFKRSRNWTDYTDTVLTLLRALDQSTTEESAPLPVLSIPVHGITPQQLGDAYEISLVPPEVANPAEDGGDAVEDADDFPDFEFDVINGNPPALRARALQEGGAVAGEYTLSMHMNVDGRVSWNIDPVGNGGPPDVLASLRALSSRLNVSFDAGYAISEGVVHSARYRDVAFDGFKWETFQNADISKEKPVPLNAQNIGAQDSLFCWLKDRWLNGSLAWLPTGGWLASNDGSLEVADFIHLDQGNVPTLTLVHVKGAKKTAANRGLAVGPYELVVSQAVKNLRHIDPQLATAEFVNRVGRQIQNAVWQAGIQRPRRQMLNAIQQHGANMARRVVVVQPHTRRQAHVQGLNAPDGTRERHLVRQLHTLLLGAQQNCAAVGATFVVVGEDAYPRGDGAAVDE